MAHPGLEGTGYVTETMFDIILWSEFRHKRGDEENGKTRIAACYREGGSGGRVNSRTESMTIGKCMHMGF